MTNIFDEFQWRGLVYDRTEGLPEVLAGSKVTAYIGFDPTSDSLQIGNLLALLGLARLQRFGHSPIALAGGGTGLIGDPSGKTQERQLQSKELIAANLEKIKPQLAQFLDFEIRSNPARIINNADWLTVIPMMDFLRDVGKHFTVNYMLAKDSVSTRLERQEGISYTEFSYMLLQAFDFLQLYDRVGCTLQAGGSDQWGNIVAGTELIRRVRGGRAFGLVYPLVTNADGTKLGKTERGTIWLDAKKTSPYRFYQYWLNATDADAIPYLRYFTWLTREEIAALEQPVRTARASRGAAHPGVRGHAHGAWRAGAGRRSEGIGSAIRWLHRGTLGSHHRGHLCRSARQRSARNRVRRCGKTGGGSPERSGRGQIQRRGAPARRVGRRVCQQLARRSPRPGRHARPRNRRPLRHPANREEAVPPGARDGIEPTGISMTLLRFLTAGESHGPLLTAILEGMIAGLPITAEAIDRDLARRQIAYGAGGRMKIERDAVRITAGVMAGLTTGAPISLEVANLDYKAWAEKDVPPMTIPRPGHADLTAAIKYGYRDLRPALERASARETTMRVAVGAICRAYLAQFGITIGGYVVSIGEVDAHIPDDLSYAERFALAESNDLRCPDPDAAEAMRKAIWDTMQAKDTLGGVFEIVATGVPAGLGSHVHFDRKLDGQLAAALMSIQAIKGVEIGPAFANARAAGYAGA